ncbi:heterogeneous nuclear ribonucleoprotein Q-like [Magnolia sinica]|uniref:heterogeneous nuclear ribonucleoprotein Q-like n=1 Tax=Magnolia sinica TaxID=86752 RepID=UPI00265B233D|nr:heterogeneous nuclear ribonucleoprotein Q-like [Magnolia sinica]XP_058090316.1 heterogeneous nuclear ribonucleoprotein Q-like [Magnolia sinica]XP_058090317.1 heterogeneous nuclear ribonucleoprotein Q-like [Magnolia sinica]XP_058090318.1 heterogeneous nuclear ribonucleoprotein Q-like [Magnolia sinica]
MKTKNSETTKPTPTKKTPPSKKESVKKTPKTKSESTPKASAPATTVTPPSKNTAKKSTPETAQKSKAEETASALKEATPAAENKSTEKKTVRKTKSPSAVKTAGEDVSSLKKEALTVEEPGATKEEENAAKEEENDGLVAVEVMKEPENNAEQVEEDPAEEPESGIGDEIVEYGERERFEEPGDEEFMEDDVSEPDREEEEVRAMDEEQMQMSDAIKERKQNKELEIFVGGLDRDANEDDVKKAFEKVGEIVEVRLLRNPLTNKNKGFAFVKFATKEQADRALSELKSPVIRGKQCGTAPSEDNDTLFLGNICNTWTKEAIRQKLKEYGVDDVENITLVGDAKNEGLSRGFAFLEFACHADAMVAYKRLQKPDVIFGHPERTAKVAFAEPLRDPDPEIMAQVKSVFVDGLPPYWDEDRVKEQFKDYGEIERVVLARNMATAKRKDFGFVDFTTHKAAIACIEGVNSTELDDGKTKTRAKARLANPLPKTQAVKGGMRGGFRIGRSGGGYSRFGRGFGRGGHPSNRGSFQRGRGPPHPRGRGRTGRLSFPDGDDLESSQPKFRGKRPFGGRGGRRGSFGRSFGESSDEIVRRGATSRFDLDRPMHGAFGRGRGKPFQFRNHPFSPEEDFGRPFGRGHFEDDSYLHDGSGHGVKRPFSMMDHESGYYEPASRLRPRYDYPDPLARETHYGDTLGTGGGLYSHDYYGSDYGGSSFSSFYGSQRSMGRGYYY